MKPQQKDRGPQPRPGRGGGKPGGKGPKSGKAPSIKNQIRSTERLLKKPDLDPKMRARQEKKLEELRASMDDHQRQERERKFAVRYHKVRFFERVKLERRLKRLQAHLAAARSGDTAGAAAAAAAAADSDGEGEGAAGAGAQGGADVAGLERQLAAIREDLEYVLHFPKGEKYVSLLRNADNPEAQEQVESERVRLRALVKRQLAEAALLAEADEGAALAGKAGGAAPPAPAAAGKPGAADQPAAAAAAGEEGGEVEDDDDFFLASDDDADAGAAVAAAEAREPPQPQRRQQQAVAAPVAGAKRKAQRAVEPEGEASDEEEEDTGASSGEEEEEEAGGEESESEEEGGLRVEEARQAPNQQQQPARHKGERPLAAQPAPQQQRQQQQRQQPGQKPQQHKQQHSDSGRKPWKQQQPGSGGKAISHGGKGKPWQQQDQQQQGGKRQQAGSNGGGGKPWQPNRGEKPFGSKPKPQREPEQKQHGGGSGAKDAAPQRPEGAPPLRKRAEGGRKRRKK